MANTPPIMLRLSDDIKAKLDQDRGELSRSEYIRRLILAVIHPASLPASSAPRARSTRQAPLDRTQVTLRPKGGKK